jgi:hypothetical protein
MPIIGKVERAQYEVWASPSRGDEKNKSAWLPSPIQLSHHDLPINMMECQQSATVIEIAQLVEDS